MLGFGRNYYSLVAGLRDYASGGDIEKGFDARAVITAISEELSEKDLRLMELFYVWYDIENIINLRTGRGRFNSLGNYSREELQEELINPERLPRALARVIEAYRNPEDTDFDDVDTGMRFEAALFEAYYAQCARSSSRFLREWSRFDRNLRNVVAAYTARGRGRNVADALVGADEITLSLRRSSAADFGLKGELEYIDQLLNALGEEADILEKERIIDNIRWEKAEELAEMDDFNMNAILSYLVRINIIHRWRVLDEETGRTMYERLVASLSARDKIVGKQR